MAMNGETGTPMERGFEGTVYERSQNLIVVEGEGITLRFNKNTLAAINTGIVAPASINKNGSSSINMSQHDAEVFYLDIKLGRQATNPTAADFTADGTLRPREGYLAVTTHDEMSKSTFFYVKIDDIRHEPGESPMNRIYDDAKSKMLAREELVNRAIGGTHEGQGNKSPAVVSSAQRVHTVSPN